MALDSWLPTFLIGEGGGVLGPAYFIRPLPLAKAYLVTLGASS